MSRVKRRMANHAGNKDAREARRTRRELLLARRTTRERLGFGQYFSQSFEISRFDPIVDACHRAIEWRDRRQCLKHASAATPSSIGWFGRHNRIVCYYRPNARVLAEDMPGYINAGGRTGNGRMARGISTAKSKKKAGPLREWRLERRDASRMWKRFCAEKGQEPTIVGAPGSGEALIEAIRTNVYASFENAGYQAALDAAKATSGELP